MSLLHLLTKFWIYFIIEKNYKKKLPLLNISKASFVRAVVSLGTYLIKVAKFSFS